MGQQQAQQMGFQQVEGLEHKVLGVRVAGHTVYLEKTKFGAFLYVGNARYKLQAEAAGLLSGLPREALEALFETLFKMRDLTRDQLQKLVDEHGMSSAQASSVLLNLLQLT